MLCGHCGGAVSYMTQAVTALQAYPRQGNMQRTLKTGVVCQRGLSKVLTSRQVYSYTP